MKQVLDLFQYIFMLKDIQNFMLIIQTLAKINLIKIVQLLNLIYMIGFGFIQHIIMIQSFGFNMYISKKNNNNTYKQ